MSSEGFILRRSGDIFGLMSRDLSTSFPLRPARVHEAYGPAAPVLAAVACGQVEGSLFWITENWLPEHLNPLGLSTFLDPARLLAARTGSQIDSLAIAEETLRDGSLGLVVLETTRPLNLREGRRLQLAAKAGGTPGLCIIPEGMGSNAAETRWKAEPLPSLGSRDSTLMRWDLKKNKSGTLGAWDVRWDAETRRLHVVSPAGE